MKVLIVDDVEDYTRTAATLLRHLGHAVSVASNGRDALDACRHDLPDVVVLDIGLPGKSGFEVATELRGEFGTAPPRLIAVSGYGRADDIQHSAEAGIDVHLVKPVNFTELEELIRCHDAPH